jgi:hypothetical protein
MTTPLWRLVSTTQPWVATAYLASYVVVGTAMFVVVITALAVAGALGLFSLGLPLFIAAAGIVRGCAQVERVRSSMVGGPIPRGYRPVTVTGIFGRIKARWTDPAILRACAYLTLLYIPLVAIDFATLVIWLSAIAGVTLPLWYRTIPDGWVSDLPTALLVTAGCLVLVMGGAYLVTTVARLHGHVARVLLGGYRDPLAEAKRVLAEPGPLVSH